MLFRLQKSQCTSKIIFSQNHSELDSFVEYVLKKLSLFFDSDVYFSSDLKSVLQQQSEVVTELIRNLKVPAQKELFTFPPMPFIQEVENSRNEIEDIRTQRSGSVILLILYTVEPLCNGHFGTRYFWPIFAAI